jgi:hypothetical protein
MERRQTKVGMRVEMGTRVLREDGERGMLVYGYKFRPIRSIGADAQRAATEPTHVPVSTGSVTTMALSAIAA